MEEKPTKRVEFITLTEEMVVNPKYKGLRTARIEVYVRGVVFLVEVGRLEVWNDDALFCEIRDLIEGRGNELEVV